MKKQTDKKLPVLTTTVRELSAPDLKAVQGGFPPGPCRTRAAAEMKKAIKKPLLLSVEKLRELDNDQLHGTAGGQECTVWTRCRVTATGQSAACR